MNDKLKVLLEDENFEPVLREHFRKQIKQELDDELLKQKVRRGVAEEQLRKLENKR